MKQTIKRSLAAIMAIVLIGVPVAAHAETTDPDTATSSDQQTTKSTYESELRAQLAEKSQERQAAMMNMQADLQQKLDTAKMKACENHEATINKLMKVMDKRRQNTLNRIAKIAEAVKGLYVKKGLSVANYDSLVAKVDAAHTVAEAAMQAQQQIPSLDCSGDHPRADIADFKEKRSASTDAVKAYRDTVKELVKAVKTSMGSGGDN